MFDFESIEESLQFINNNNDDDDNSNNNNKKREISTEAAAKRAAFEAAKLVKTKVSKHELKVKTSQTQIFIYCTFKMMYILGVNRFLAYE